MEVLNPQAGERILDLGCGTDQLSTQIAAAGAEVVGIDLSAEEVVGIDLSAEMVVSAREQFPDLVFAVGDARDFSFAEPFDAVLGSPLVEEAAVLLGVLSALTHRQQPESAAYSSRR